MSQNGDNGDHPQWAIDQALDLLKSLSMCHTHAEMMNFVSLALRKAYHRGRIDNTVETLKKEAPH